ncbi:glycosyltransferase 87 family protein [Solwaraspora sp. WMMB335]|uniref:glycosyltransferase 87 family protein n=1 Tax=Solwaraspora sp. WMMB335 TaxID=3404118 RepID=UPI003B950BAE
MSVVAVWVATRAVFVLVYTEVIAAPVGGVFADVALYHRWSEVLLDGRVPGSDPMWQYPPGAAALFVAVRCLTDGSPASYEATFFASALAADLLVLVVLLRLAHRDGLLLGACAWGVVVPLVNLLTYARYDIFATAVVVVALAATLRRPVTAGAAIAIGTLVKAWPVVLLISTRPVAGLRPTLTGFTATLTALGGVLTIGFAGAWSAFTGNQADRGLQIESVGATPLVLARLWDDRVDVEYVYGAMEFVAGPFVHPATIVLPVLTVAGLGLLGVWWLVHGPRIAWTAATGFDVALLAVLVTVVTSRVFSPQYMLWLIGVSAVCLTRRDTTQRRTSLLIMVATALTSALFPWFYEQVSTDPQWPGTALLAARNSVVLVALGVGVRALSRAPSRMPRPTQTAPADGGGPQMLRR